MCLDPYKNWIQVDPIFEFLKLLLSCDVALSSPITTRIYSKSPSSALFLLFLRSSTRSSITALETRMGAWTETAKSNSICTSALYIKMCTSVDASPRFVCRFIFHVQAYCLVVLYTYSMYTYMLAYLTTSTSSKCIITPYNIQKNIFLVIF